MALSSSSDQPATGNSGHVGRFYIFDTRYCRDEDLLFFGDTERFRFVFFNLKTDEPLSEIKRWVEKQGYSLQLLH
jgi:hypothetical protein